ncbi:MAG: PepSY-associated TM helix domain-containing protein [Gammaproteobacteria bacterium]
MKFNNARQAMTWLHTWLGLLMGFVLMVCFFFGTLSVFDREIDRWTTPQTRFEPQPMPSFDKMLLSVFKQIEAEPNEYNTFMPAYHDASAGPMTPRLELPMDEFWAYTTHRDPALRMGVAFGVPFPKDKTDHNHIHGEVSIDPRSGNIFSENHLKIGSEWFYPLHYSLNFKWKNMGYYIVGAAAFFMLVALVTGIVIHRKIFREFFTFRPWKNKQRSTLDLHNMSGVVALPFHFFFALTGLIIFASTFYLPTTNTMLKPLHDMHEAIEAEHTGLPYQRSGISAPLASVDAMMAEAKRRWAARDMAGEIGFLFIDHIGDANSYVSIYRAGSDRVALVGEGIHFKASSGKVLSEDPPHTIVSGIDQFLTGLHLQHFEHWLLRWLYVLGGLLGCVCIATGFLFFVGKRKQQHATINSQGSRIVDAMAVTTITGMVIAAVTMLLANRLFPADMAGKGEWEKLVFWGAWLLTMAHAFWRSSPVAKAGRNPAWREQCLVLTGLAISAVIANWLSTGDHLVKTLMMDTYWAVAGVDLNLIGLALISWLVAGKLNSVSIQKQSTMSEDVVYE